ncbi:MAG: ABC transporter substrate-binding protein [Vicinamibacterales bacterium]
MRGLVLPCLFLGLSACAAPSASPTLTLAASAVGREGALVQAQLARFEAAHPGLRVEVRSTPDEADTRHQLYVHWLNAHAPEPDVLQLDVIWTPEFAAAGWILPLDRFEPAAGEFLPAAVAADSWRGQLFALPWFVDVGMLYWRTDLADRPPDDLAALAAEAARPGSPTGFVWQGARYEGLVTVFLEHLGGFGGRILDVRGRVVVDREPAVRALEYMRDCIHVRGAVPPDVLSWQEEHARFAFQNGSARFMRNWPYAVPLLSDATQSKVAGRFAVAPMPAGPGGASTAALGGAQLAINARSEQPELAFALIQFLLSPAQMIERAQVAGQYPSRPSLYDDAAVRTALPIPAAEARAIVERAVARPATPVYSELSGILQVHLHRALTRQAEPRAALETAAKEMRALLSRAGLDAEGR